MPNALQTLSYLIPTTTLLIHLYVLWFSKSRPYYSLYTVLQFFCKISCMISMFKSHLWVSWTVKVYYVLHHAKNHLLLLIIIHYLFLNKSPNKFPKSDFIWSFITWGSVRAIKEKCLFHFSNSSHIWDRNPINKNDDSKWHSPEERIISVEVILGLSFFFFFLKKSCLFFFFKRRCIHGLAHLVFNFVLF